MWILPFIITVPPMEANIGKLFEWHGPGVYTVAVRAQLDRGDEVISTYSVFHEVETLGEVRTAYVRKLVYWQAWNAVVIPTC